MQQANAVVLLLDFPPTLPQYSSTYRAPPVIPSCAFLASKTHTLTPVDLYPEEEEEAEDWKESEGKERVPDWAKEWKRVDWNGKSAWHSSEVGAEISFEVEGAKVGVFVVSSRLLGVCTRSLSASEAGGLCAGTGTLAVAEYLLPRTAVDLERGWEPHKSRPCSVLDRRRRRGGQDGRCFQFGCRSKLRVSSTALFFSVERRPKTDVALPVCLRQLPLDRRRPASSHTVSLCTSRAVTMLPDNRSLS